MKKIITLGVLSVMLLATATCNAYIKTFNRHYDSSDEVITKVGSVTRSWDYPEIIPEGGVHIVYEDRYLVALEGYNRSTRVPFCRLQCLDKNGSQIDDYIDAYVGEPGQPGAGLFLLENPNKVMTPFIHHETDNRFKFQWRNAYPDSNVTLEGQLLPDSINAIEAFPTALTSHYINDDSSWANHMHYLMAGRATVNGTSRCFFIDADSLGHLGYFQTPLIFPDSMEVITGVSAGLHGYVIAGITTEGKGRLLLMDYSGNPVWNKDFALGGSCLSLMTSFLYFNYVEDYHTVTISYQDDAQVMHIGMLTGTDYDEAYTEQLDEWMESIPLQITKSYPFSPSGVNIYYAKNAKQYLRYVSYSENYENQTHYFGDALMIPGSDTSDMAFSYYYTEYFSDCYFLTAGYLADGGFWVKNAGVDGLVEYDTTIHPDQTHLKVFPNPFINGTHISFELKNPGKVRLEVYNLKGQKIADLGKQDYPSGKFVERWIPNDSAKEIPAGVYFVKMDYDGKTKVKKLLYYNDHYIAPPYYYKSGK